MADSTIDWTDETPRPLPELACLAFPDGGVTGETLRRRARQGKLPACRPGKSYLASLSDVRVMIEKTRVHPAQERAPHPTPIVPNSLGLTEMDLSNRALDQALAAKLTRPANEAKRLRDDERAKYRQKKAERARGAPK